MLVCSDLSLLYIAEQLPRSNSYAALLSGGEERAVVGSEQLLRNS